MRQIEREGNIEYRWKVDETDGERRIVRCRWEEDDREIMV
jgi:hypothetical protein